MRRLRCLIVVLLFAATPFPTAATDIWTGDVYPDATNLPDNIFIGFYVSFESCRNAALTILRRANWIESGALECGLNCKYDEEFNMSVCKETREWSLHDGWVVK